VAAPALGDNIVYNGTQQGRVAVKEQQLHVAKLRLRRMNPKEGEPAEVEIPAYEAMRKDGRLADRMLEIVIAGVSTRRYQDDEGKKHLLGLREGATENSVVANALLEDLASRGLDSKRRRLFAFDGSLALRKAIDLI
jgi:hypothetical protein